MNKCLLTLTFEFGSIDGKTMKVEILPEIGKLIVLDPGIDQTLSCDIEIILPTTIKIEISNKNMSTDTIIDEHHNILKDKYVKLSALQLDKIAIPYHWLEKQTKILVGSETYHTNYFGFNGTCAIELPRSTVFQLYANFLREL